MFDVLSRNSPPRKMDFDEQRRWMVEHQLMDWGIRDSRVLKAMSTVPRERFVPAAERDAAYYDGALPIGEGQTISQPYVVAHMSEILGLQGHERVLEIGTGLGYQAAVLSLLAAQVYTVERIARLSQEAEAVLKEVGATNVTCLVGDGSLGWPEFAPYDAILVACAAPEVPPPLVEQLADGGRLVIPIGPRGFQDLVLVRRKGGKTTQERLAPVAFVPLVGEYGW